MSWCFSIVALSKLKVAGLTKPFLKTRHRLLRGSLSIGLRQNFRGKESIVTDVAQCFRDGTDIKMTEADGVAIRVHEMHVAKLVADVPQRGRAAGLFDVHVKQIA